MNSCSIFVANLGMCHRGRSARYCGSTQRATSTLTVFGLDFNRRYIDIRVRVAFGQHHATVGAPQPTMWHSEPSPFAPSFGELPPQLGVGQDWRASILVGPPPGHVLGREEEDAHWSLGTQDPRRNPIHPELYARGVRIPGSGPTDN